MRTPPSEEMFFSEGDDTLMMFVLGRADFKVVYAYGPDGVL